MPKLCKSSKSFRNPIITKIFRASYQQEITEIGPQLSKVAKLSSGGDYHSLATSWKPDEPEAFRTFEMVMVPGVIMLGFAFISPNFLWNIIQETIDTSLMVNEFA